MQGLYGLTWLLGAQSLGELLARGLGLPFPGPVLGLLLMLVALRWRTVREPVAVCAQFLLRHLSLLFVPVGVGVMVHAEVLRHYGVALLVAIVVSTWLGLAVTAAYLKHRLGSGHD
ncbi:MAG: CidA/LrgA family protein [Rhodoferax sp.]